MYKAKGLSNKYSNFFEIKNLVYYKMNENTSLLSNILIFSLQLLILYYLKSIQGASCNCLQDWRGTVIMLTSVISASFAILNVAMPGYTATLPVMLMVLLLVLQLINAYSLFTYVGDLNSTNCACVVQKHPMLNSFLWYYRYVPVVAFGFMAILFMNKLRHFA
jgi:hypothetical protein